MFFFFTFMQSNKLRTATIHRNLNPEFQETLTYHGISAADLSAKTLQILVMGEHFLCVSYSCFKMLVLRWSATG